MNLLVLFMFGIIRSNVGVRLAEEDVSLRQNPTIKSACPDDGAVKEDENGDGFCLDANSEADLPYFCCNVLRSCRQDATTVFDHYTKYLKVYEDVCGVSDADFRLSRDGQMLTLVDASANGPACQPLCKIERELQDKPELDINIPDIVDKCNGVVAESVWKPQLDGAAWPIAKVTELDASWTACGGRRQTTTTTTLQEVETTTTTTLTFTAEEPAFEHVDMSFMGSDRAYAGHVTSGWWYWANRKTRPDVREEVLKGHKCATRGGAESRAQTYYASSLCYWLPEVETVQRSDDGFGIGLEWTGSLLGADKKFCGGFTESKGKCMKCSVCHDNARNKDGTVNFEAWPEEIALDYESENRCLKEKVIESECEWTFSQTHAPLIAKMEDCTQKKAKFDSAETLHEQALAMLEALPRLINIEIPLRRAALDEEKSRLRKVVNNAQKEDSDILFKVIDPDCEAMVTSDLSPGWPIWWKAWEENWPTKYILGNMTFAVNMMPDRSDPNYNKKQIYRDAQVMCDKARKKLKVSFDKTSVAEQEKAYNLDLIEQLKVELATRIAELEYWTAAEPGLKQTREDMAAIWNPLKAECNAKIEEFNVVKPQEMRRCIPGFYEQSCEKACIEVQKVRSEGCGVMEGGMPQDPLSRGGVRSVCRPPVASWVEAPNTWQADEEPGYKQCQRIFLKGEQNGHHAQRVLLRGWMEKKSRWGQWQRRFFIFESGSEMRSAVMRYWLEDPGYDRHAPERVDKAIILWDAKRVQKSEILFQCGPLLPHIQVLL